MIDYNDIKQTIAENLPDNNRREITAARLRDTLDGFVDKVQVTETDLEGKVSVNETNIGNLSGRMDTNEADVTNLTGRVDTNEANVTNLTGRVDSLSGEVSGLSGRVDDLSGSIGNPPRIVDNPIKGGTNDVASVKWDTTIAAIAGLYTAESPIGGNALKINKVSVIDGGYVKSDGTIVQLVGYSYFEYTLLKKNGYITIPAQEYGSIAASDGGAIDFAFYDKGGNVIGVNSDIIDWSFSGQLELKVPYGATMIRASLINGTFDPDNLYVIESTQPNNCNQLYNLRRKFNECKPTVDYLARIDNNGNPVIDGRNWLSVVRLLEGDELEAEISDGEGASLAVGDSYNIEETKNVIYIYNGSLRCRIYYRADKDCYAFISQPSSFKVIHNSSCDFNQQYELAALANRIWPTIGEVVTDYKGVGKICLDEYGDNMAVIKVPVLAGTTLSYVAHFANGYKGWHKTAYWYSGQPTPTASVNTEITVDSNSSVFTINNTGSNKSGYAIITLTFEANVSKDDILSSYLQKAVERT